MTLKRVLWGLVVLIVLILAFMMLARP